MKIIFTVASYYPSRGGVQTVTKYLTEGLVKRGHKVTVITPKKGRNQFHTEYNGVKMIYSDVYTYRGMHKGDKHAYVALVESECSDADVLVNVSLQTATTDLLLDSLSKFKCKKVLYLHDIHNFSWEKQHFTSFGDLLRKLWYNTRWKIFYFNAYKKIANYDVITHLSEFDASIEYMLKHNIKQNVIMGNAAEDVFFETGINSNAGFIGKHFLCIGNYEAHKNQELALRAFYNMKNDDQSLIFIGREETAYYKKLIGLKKELDKKYGYRDARLLVNVERNETINYIRNAKAMVLSSNLERFPVVLVEGMASGIPFISTDQGCVKYLPGGMVVKSEQEITYWMDFLCEQKELTTMLGNVGQKYAKKNLTIPSKVSTFEQLLQ